MLPESSLLAKAALKQLQQLFRLKHGVNVAVLRQTEMLRTLAATSTNVVQGNNGFCVKGFEYVLRKHSIYSSQGEWKRRNNSNSAIESSEHCPCETDPSQTDCAK